MEEKHGTDAAKRYSKRIPGIGRAAKALGCNRDHLRWVIQGKRKSPKLLASYQALISSTAGTDINPMTKEEFQKTLLAKLESLKQSVESLRILDELGVSRLKQIKNTLTEANATLREISSFEDGFQAGATAQQEKTQTR